MWGSRQQYLLIIRVECSNTKEGVEQTELHDGGAKNEQQ